MTDGPHVLLVEDDEPTRSAVGANLRGHGYRVAEAGSIADAMRAWDADRPDLVLLDLGLPDGDGATFIRRVRRDTTTPILVLSARGLEPDKVGALDAGADDYLTKPFGLGELRSRMAAVMRRATGPAAGTDGVIELGPIRLDPARRSATVRGTPVDFTPREYELLKTLLANQGRLVTKQRLLRAVWGTAYADEEHYLHVYVSRLRRKLEAADPDAGTRSLIAAEPGVGYRVADAGGGEGSPGR
ncbi:MAG: response regulator transcription factor [Chloroflexota bacterium]